MMPQTCLEWCLTDHMHGCDRLDTTRAGLRIIIVRSGPQLVPTQVEASLSECTFFKPF